MAGLLKKAVVILVLVAVAKQFIAADEDTAEDAPTTSALQEASPEPEEPTRRDGQLEGRYPVELCNPFYEFWAGHTSLWTLRTSDSIVSQCKRQERKELNATGVLLTQLSRSDEQTTSLYYYWTFGEDDAMYYYSKGCSNYGSLQVCYEFKVKAVLEYQDSTNNCSVVRYEEWYYHTASEKDKYHKKCQETWCMCNTTESVTHPYACRNDPFYELVTHDTPTENAPTECKKYYDGVRVQYRSTDRQVYKKGCENFQQLTST